jgi:hypothetical protein
VLVNDVTRERQIFHTHLRFCFSFWFCGLRFLSVYCGTGVETADGTRLGPSCLVALVSCDLCHLGCDLRHARVYLDHLVSPLRPLERTGGSQETRLDGATISQPTLYRPHARHTTQYAPSTETNLLAATTPTCIT